jgi:hypothetical protein
MGVKMGTYEVFGVGGLTGQDFDLIIWDAARRVGWLCVLYGYFDLYFWCFRFRHDVIVLIEFRKTRPKKN